MRRFNGYRHLILMLALAVPTLAHATPAIDLVAGEVTFQQSGGTWKVHAAYSVMAESTTEDWSYSYSVKQYRNGNLLGTVISGSEEIGAGDTGCTVMCNGTCWVGQRRGTCYWGNPCICDTGTKLIVTITAQAGDVFVLELSTAETELSTTNNSSQGAF